MAIPEHSKIINKLAKQILKPKGLQRKGQSRVWLDDNGWYTTIVEFQPFKDRKGSCINVGVNFHWYLKDGFSFDMGYRESDFIDFENEEQFSLEMEKLAHFAFEKVLVYRKVFSEFNTAKEFIENNISDSLWGNYHKGTICGLAGDLNGLRDCYRKLMTVEHDVPWANELKRRASELKETSSSKREFQQKIFNIIRETRELKKLKQIEIKTS